jgi:Heterokaryon incompatibility protein (HET)
MESLALGSSCRFEPLTSPRQIRILHLASRNGDDQLNGRLQHLTLDEATDVYEAVSYEWGNPETKHSIAIEGGFTIRITESLYHALRDIRPQDSSGKERAVWADAVCINQEDMSERQQQVALMGDIYRRACRVITYIGPERDDSAMGINLACSLIQYAISNADAPDPRIHFPEELPNVGLPPISDPRWRALKALLFRGWVSNYPYDKRKILVD